MPNLVFMFVSTIHGSILFGARKESSPSLFTIPTVAGARARVTLSTNTTVASLEGSPTVFRTSDTVLTRLAIAIADAIVANWSWGRRWWGRRCWVTNRNICPSWGGGCIDRVDNDCQGGASSTNVIDGIDPTCVEFGDEVGFSIANTAGAGTDKNLISALHCFRVKSNLTIEVNICVRVAICILNPDNHLVVCVGGVLLGKADKIAAPVVVVRRKVDVISVVPTQLPTLWSIEAHFREFIAAV
jgi:hypothetical protein